MIVQQPTAQQGRINQRRRPTSSWCSVSSWATALLAIVASQMLLFALAAEDTASGKLPPPFFLQDPNDSLCLAGEEFKRCSIDTLWYATGTHGAYQIHKRPMDGIVDNHEDGLCLSKKSCKEADIGGKPMEVKVTKCSHCGSKGWNILGDNDVGYTLMIDNGKTCLARVPATDGNSNPTVNDKAMAAPCDSTETPMALLQLQFASASDIATMSSPGARLVSAATDGDKKQVQAILKEDGVDVTATDWDGLNALIPAASQGHLDLVKFLIKEGIDVNAADKDGITALMEAAIMGHIKIVEYLLDHGAQVDQKAQSDITALWLAASEGRTNVVQLLIKKGADASNARVDQISAIMTAALGGHADMVKLLLAQDGVTAFVTDKESLTPLHNACEKGNVQVVKVLLDSIKNKDDRKKYIEFFSETGFNAIIIASAHGHADVVDLLLDYGANASVGCTDSLVTALMYAAANHKHDVMKLLLGKGKADLEQKHKGGGTALIEAGTGGALESLKMLVEAGADIDARDEDGVSVTMATASSGILEGLQFVWKLLEEKGLAEQEINRMSFSGGTPIMFAAAGGHAPCVQHFLDNGAHVDVRSKATEEYLEKLQQHVDQGTAQDHERHVDDVTPLHVAAQGGHLECIEALLKAGADTSLIDALGRTPLQVAISGNYGDSAIALVKAGSDPNTPYTDEEGVAHNLLFDSIMVENVEFATVLIEKGADLYHKDDKQVSTLLQASHRGLLSIVELLIKAHKTRGSESSSYLNEASDEGVTPLIAAASEGHDEVVKFLIDSGAQINSKDNDGTSALMAASARGHLPIVKLLVDAGADLNEQNQDGHSALMFAYNGKNQVETLMERYQQYYTEQQEQQANEGSGSETLEEDGGTVPIIQEALANHTALVDYLLLHGADPALKDKEGHTAKDFDYQADNPAVFGGKSASISAGTSAKEEL